MTTPIVLPSTLNHIDVFNERDVHYWCHRFRCSAAQLRAAVAAVGSDVEAVKTHATGLGYAHSAGK